MLFLQKMQNFLLDPQDSPPIANFWLRAWLELRHVMANPALVNMANVSKAINLHQN